MPIVLQEIIKRYQFLTTPLIYDVLDQMGYPNQVLSVEIRPLEPNMRTVGWAFTIAGKDADSDADPSLFNRLFREIQPGSVLVMATYGHLRSGPWGENAALSALMRGACGLVTDGGVRDAEAISTIGFPTFCRFVTPVSSYGRFIVTEYQIPVSMPGQLEPVIVHPGDMIVADRNGIVVVPATLVEEVLLAAEELFRIEEQIRAALRAGEDREVVYQRHQKFKHIRKIFQGEV